jgi:hypothetical protein
MFDERREIPRFSVNLSVSRINHQESFGKVEDFSRRGMRVILDTPDIDQTNEVQIGIQQPDYNELVSTVSSVAWKRCFEGRCEVGLKFKNFPVQAKADFLDYGYKKWLKEKSCF